MKEIRVKNSVLMIVDVQNGFITGETRHVLPVICKLLRRWQQSNGEVIFTQYFNHPGSAFERLMDWRFLYSPPDTDIADDVSRHIGDSPVISKGTYSAFTPRFAELLSSRKWTDVIICGIDTDLCVLKTALDAFEYDLTPWIVVNASASTGGNEFHEAGLKVIGRAIGEQHLLRDEEFLPIH